MQHKYAKAHSIWYVNLKIDGTGRMCLHTRILNRKAHKRSNNRLLFRPKYNKRAATTVIYRGNISTIRFNIKMDMAFATMCIKKCLVANPWFDTTYNTLTFSICNTIYPNVYRVKATIEIHPLDLTATSVVRAKACDD